MTSFAGGKIEAFCGPLELAAPDDLEQTIIDFINGATRSLLIAVQELDSMLIAQAILDARLRKVRVRMVVETDYLEDEDPPKVTVQPGETEEAAKIRAQWTEDPPRELDVNRHILSVLFRSGVKVRTDYNAEIFHQKFIIRDYEGRSPIDTSSLLSGSANFTHTDGHLNLNHVVIFHEPEICKLYWAEFQRMMQGQFGRWLLGDVPKTINVSGVPVRVLFAPDQTPELEIVKQMLKCQEDGNVDFAIFTFSGSSGIDDAMVMLRRAGVTIRGALDPGQGAQDWAATPWLHDKGVEVFFPRRDPPFRKLHHKLMVIDDSIVVAGSFNYTAPANEYNDENIFVLGSPFDLDDDEGGPVDQAECAKVCGYFRDEIDRIIDDMSEPFVP